MRVIDHRHGVRQAAHNVAPHRASRQFREGRGVDAFEDRDVLKEMGGRDAVRCLHYTTHAISPQDAIYTILLEREEVCQMPECDDARRQHERGARTRTVLLVRHATPEIVPEQPARTWSLSAEGRRRCAPLAERLASYGPTVIVTSEEPKASETAHQIAQRLAVPVVSAPNLHEHERENTPWYPSKAAFDAVVAGFFARPHELVFGEETADRARERFTSAVYAVLRQHQDDTIVIVTHGTVLSLFVAWHTDAEPLPVWREMGLPAFVALAVPNWELLAIVNDL